jgi:hypothetical protein
VGAVTTQVNPGGSEPAENTSFTLIRIAGRKRGEKKEDGGSKPRSAQAGTAPAAAAAALAK